jgi:gamma-glutamyl phosphate reductase
MRSYLGKDIKGVDNMGMLELAQSAKKASIMLSAAETELKNRALEMIAKEPGNAKGRNNKGQP